MRFTGCSYRWVLRRGSERGSRLGAESTFLFSLAGGKKRFGSGKFGCIASFENHWVQFAIN